ncbi:MAG TPA: hypothetical protein VHP33_02130 [Polyangiaceae bacterium]|nr:hypothetical protein [Polyangiaceae bacterium]
MTTRALLERARTLAGETAHGLVLERRALALACVVQSCAWVEGFANDVYESCSAHVDDPSWLTMVTKRDLVRRTALLWEEKLSPRGMSAVEKWSRLLKHLGLKLATSPEREAMVLLVELRNAFVHAEPMVHPTENEAHRELEAKLGGRFGLDSGNGFLWPRVLSVGCAEWAFGTAREFGLHVAATLGMPDPFAPVL